MRIVVPGTLDGLAEAMRTAEEFCRQVQLPMEARAKVLTALDEVLANVVHHALAGGQGMMEVAIAQADGCLTIGVADSAAPFDPLQLPAPDTSLPLEARRIGGLGIALVRALTDEVAYERREGQNHLTLTWRVGTDVPKDGHAD